MVEVAAPATGIQVIATAAEELPAAAADMGAKADIGSIVSDCGLL